MNGAERAQAGAEGFAGDGIDWIGSAPQTEPAGEDIREPDAPRERRSAGTALLAALLAALALAWIAPVFFYLWRTRPPVDLSPAGVDL